MEKPTEKLILNWEEVKQIVYWIGKQEDENELWQKLITFYNKYDPIELHQQEFINKQKNMQNNKTSIITNAVKRAKNVFNSNFSRSEAVSTTTTSTTSSLDYSEESKEKTIGVIGYGYLGKAIVNLFKKHYKVLIYDPYYVKKVMVEPPPLSEDEVEFIGDFAFVKNIKQLSNVELAVVAVPTPMKDDGSCDTSIVEEVVKELDNHLILIKSTIPPNTVDKLKKKYNKRICFSPEFAGESSYWTPYKFHTNMKEMPYYIFGGSPLDTQELVDIYIPIVGPTKKFYQTDAKTAEMTKYVENMFYAMKITFCNEIYEICERLGLDYWKVRELWLADPRINSMHTAVFKDSRGYGGKCFPKDVSALIQIAEEYNYNPELLKQVKNSNKKFRNL